MFFGKEVSSYLSQLSGRDVVVFISDRRINKFIFATSVEVYNEVWQWPRVENSHCHTHY